MKSASAWMDIFEATRSDLERVHGDMKRLEGDNSNIRQKRNLAKKLTSARDNLTKLQRQLLQMEANPSGFGIGVGELERRRGLLAELQSLQKQADASINDRSNSNVSFATRRAGGKAAKETEETMYMTDQALVQEQKQTIEQQDEKLDVLADGLTKLKYMGQDINAELGLHERLLDDIENAVEKTDARIQSNTKGVEEIQMKSKSNCCIFIVMVLLLAIIVFLIASPSTLESVCKKK
eukprot:CAMPEP_0175155726 /NCGR_PEP_ID=MMETSP0087-20121206/21163_1 /TAXON_ID=136419 /ORGANISM="Unknown Unknown, Strain D1" /LENGTH=236 /DNA_ID=CAMNT_0016442969 /DNA_START=39 /DNA_END=749 /DNA_ORIENTATION=-